jgi:hypothetical protein
MVGHGEGLSRRRWSDTVSLPGIAVKRTASLPLAYDPAIHHFRIMHFAKMDGYAGQARV